MPYNQSQMRLFRAAAHNPDIAKKHKMTRKQARRMMHEGEKYSPKDKGHGR
jgi:hypothetical protein